jgi:hypothetical protein
MSQETGSSVEKTRGKRKRTADRPEVEVEEEEDYDPESSIRLRRLSHLVGCFGCFLKKMACKVQCGATTCTVHESSSSSASPGESGSPPSPAPFSKPVRGRVSRGARGRKRREDTQRNGSRPSRDDLGPNGLSLLPPAPEAAFEPQQPPLARSKPPRAKRQRTLSPPLAPMEADVIKEAPACEDLSPGDGRV